MSIREASAQLHGRGPAFPISLLFLLFGAAIPAMAVPISITGQFMGEGGHGAARVKVELVPLAAASDSAPPLATAASDASGRFRLEAPEPGMWKVLAHAEGYMPLETELAPLVEPADLPPAKLKAAPQVEVRVIGEDGSPLAGARVQAEPKAQPGTRPGWRPAVRAAVTDAKGIARLARRDDEALILHAVAGGHLEVSQPWTASAAVRLRLEPCRERTIELQDPRGKNPLRGIGVRAREGSWKAGSDERGRASICAPAGRDLSLIFESRGIPFGKGTLRPARKEDASPAVFQLADPPTASGKVVDAATRRPLAGALVWPEGHPAAFVRAAADGSWTVALSTAADGRVHAAAPGYLPALAQAFGAPAAGPILAMSPRPTGDRTASGVVLDEGGRPVAGAAIDLVSSVGSATEPLPKEGSAVSARSDQQGRFKSRLSQGSWDLRAGAPGLVATVVRGIVVGPGRTPVDLGTVVLHRGGTLEGQVVDPQGKPVAGCQVRVLPAGGMTSTRFFAAGVQEENTETLSGPDGGFTLTGLPEGRPVALVVSGEGYLSAALRGISIPAEHPLRVTLSPGSRISGRVVDESGAPVTRAQVLAVYEGQGPGGGGATESLDENGGFVIENVSPGRFTLAVAAPGFQPAQRKGIEVVAGKDVSGLEVTVRKGATVEGRVTTTEGRPVAGAHLRVMPTGNAGNPLLAALGLPEAVADGDGAYQLAGVPEGTRSIVAEERDHPKATQTLAVQSGSNHLDFQLADGREVSGRVVDPQGQPIPGAEVSLSSQSGAWQAATGPDGGFLMTAVPDGAYRLLAEKEGWARARSPEVRVAGGPVAGLVLQLDRGGAIVGRISGLGFEELSGLQLSASGPTGGQLGQVDYQGSYRIDALSPGEWTVEAHLPDNRRAVGRAQLAPGQAQASLDLEFGGGLTLSGVVLHGEQPVVGAMVTVQGSNGGLLHGMRSGSDGRFRVEGLPPGPVEVVVQGKDAPFRQPLDLSADREIVLRLP
jgi:uncharacterized GH25 family protein